MAQTLLNPGPVNVSARVRRARPDLCHREPDYIALQEETRALLRELFAPDHLCAMITGSGTAAVEMALTSAVPRSGRCLVLNHGVYGQRMVEMCDAHGIECVELKGAWTGPPDLDRLRGRLDVDAVAWVHHETTTGMLLPSHEIARLAHEAGAITLVDAISALGGEGFDPREQDLVVATANKCVQGLPGVAFALVRPELVRSMTQPRSVYLHLPRYLDGVPFTPAVQTMLALRDALLELQEETVAGRIARYRRAARILREGFERLDYDFLLPPELRSNTLTALRLREPYDRLHDRCREAGFVIYKGQAEHFFRVANMGWIPTTALKRFLEVLACEP